MKYYSSIQPILASYGTFIPIKESDSVFTAFN